MEGVLRHEQGSTMLIRAAGVAMSLLVSVLPVPIAMADPDPTPATNPPQCRQDIISGKCEMTAGDEHDQPSTTGNVTPGTKKPGGIAVRLRGPDRSVSDRGWVLRRGFGVLSDADGFADLVGELGQ